MENICSDKPYVTSLCADGQHTSDTRLSTSSVLLVWNITGLTSVNPQQIYISGMLYTVVPYLIVCWWQTHSWHTSLYFIHSTGLEYHWTHFCQPIADLHKWHVIYCSTLPHCVLMANLQLTHISLLHQFYWFGISLDSLLSTHSRSTYERNK